MEQIKYLSKTLFVLSIFIIQTNFSSALSVCPGQPVTLSWSTQGTVTSCPTQIATDGSGLCNFRADLGNNYSGNQPVTLTNPGDSCIVNFQCQNGTKEDGTPNYSNLGIATLDVVNRGDEWNGSACVCKAATPMWNAGAGTCQACPAATPIWNGSACVAQTWTNYCTPIGDANPNQIWQYDDGTPRTYRNTGNPCCSATGAMSACVVAPVPETWTTYCPLSNAPIINLQWQVSNKGNYRQAASGAACCSATGAMSRELGSGLSLSHSVQKRKRELGSGLSLSHSVQAKLKRN